MLIFLVVASLMLCHFRPTCIGHPIGCLILRHPEVFILDISFGVKKLRGDI